MLTSVLYQINTWIWYPDLVCQACVNILVSRPLKQVKVEAKLASILYCVLKMAVDVKSILFLFNSVLAKVSEEYLPCA